MAEVKVIGVPPKKALKLDFSFNRSIFGESRELLYRWAKDCQFILPLLENLLQLSRQWRNWLIEEILLQTLKYLIGGRCGPPHWLKEWDNYKIKQGRVQFRIRVPLVNQPLKWCSVVHTQFPGRSRDESNEPALWEAGFWSSRCFSLFPSAGVIGMRPSSAST